MFLFYFFLTMDAVEKKIKQSQVNKYCWHHLLLFSFFIFYFSFSILIFFNLTNCEIASKRNKIKNDCKTSMAAKINE